MSEQLQVAFRRVWASLDKSRSVPLLGAIEALKASTLRLPVVRAIADIQSLKEAVSSALDVMQAMGSSICSLLLKIDSAKKRQMQGRLFNTKDTENSHKSSITC